jgi:two-component system response regulator HydG
VSVFVLNDHFPGNEHVEFLRHVRYWYPETQIIVVADSPSYSSAVEAIKLGAFDYLPKPLDREGVRHTIERAMEQSRIEMGLGLARQSVDAEGAWGMVGRSPAMTKVFNIITKIARNIHPILILGESGTGKELAARAIHFSSARKDRPFIPIDCVALVPTLMESELFGHEKGSFTGADRANEGLLRIAEGGTVFFDEVADVPVELQGKLLRALQEKEVRPVGSTKRIRIDVRVIAATNRNLEKEIREGRFRKDLYFRLNVVTLKLPPLRDRMEDIRPLVETFLERIAKSSGQPKRDVSAEAYRILQSYSWPGNVRELQNFVERAVALSSADQLQPIDFPTEISSRVLRSFSSGNEPLRRVGRVLPIAEIEKHAIVNAVFEAKGDKLLAARMLGIGKTTLYRKLRQYERKSRGEALGGEADSPAAL